MKKRQYTNKIGQRYEDQVVPARRNGGFDLEEEIAKYEQEMANREANPSTINHTPDIATL
jgi:hypothetical protein